MTIAEEIENWLIPKRKLTSTERYIVEKVEKATRKEMLLKLENIWNKRTFITGNIGSQWTIEKAYMDGWKSCFKKIKEELGGIEK